MKQVLAIAALLAGLGLAGAPARAQGYVVNSRTASQAEVQLLVSYGLPPGRWLVDGFGISAADHQPVAQKTSGRKCYYVLDVLLCD